MDLIFSDLSDIKKTKNYYESEYQKALKKQLKLLQDDLSHIEIKKNIFVDSYLRPIDTVSGDLYETIDLGDDVYLLYVIDAMGKGLSASFTAMQSSVCLKRSLSYDTKFDKTLKLFVDFFKTILLENEILCINIVQFDLKTNQLQMANFGMPQLLIEYEDKRVETSFANNAPITQYSDNVDIKKISIENFRKILLFSDGLNEVLTKENEQYDDELLRDDFVKSNTVKELLQLRADKVEKNSDDLTVIYVRKFKENSFIRKEFSAKSSMQEIIKSTQEVKEYLENLGVDRESLAEISFLTNELMVNALEHGNYGLSSKEKQWFIKKNSYSSYINDMETINFNKTIDTLLSQYFEDDTIIIKITITDCGNGFDVSSYFKSIAILGDERLNGRGIIMSKEFVDGIFYNEKGNSVSIIKTVYRGKQ